MVRMRVDGELRKKLLNFTKPIEFCDEDNNVLGRLEPVTNLGEFERWEPEFDEEELQRREQSRKWYSTAEVLARLRQLEDEQ